MINISNGILWLMWVSYLLSSNFFDTLPIAGATASSYLGIVP